MKHGPPHWELALWGALALASSLLISWPLAANLGTHTLVGLHNPDVMTSVWWYDQVADSLRQLQDPFTTERLLYPLGTHIGANIWNIGAPLAAAPLSWIFGPVGGLNAAAIAFTALTGALAGFGARRLGADRWAAGAACVMGASLAFGVVEVASGRGEQGLLAPILLTLLGWSLLREGPGRRGLAVATGAALGLCGVVYWMGGYMVGLVLVADLAWRAARRRVDRLVLVDLLWMGGATALVALPFLVPVAIGTSTGSDHRLLDATQAGGIDGAVALPWVLEGPFAPMQVDASRRWPLLAFPVLALGAWRLRGAPRWLAVVGLGCAVMALGRQAWLPFLVAGEALALPLPHRALDLLPGMDRFWWPYRWSMLLLPCAALVLGALLGSLQSLRWRLPACLLVVGWSLYEGAAMMRLSPALQPFPMTEVKVPPVFQRLGQQPGQHPILQFPPEEVSAGLVHWQVWHEQPIHSSIGWQLPGAIPSSWEPAMREHALLDTLIFDAPAKPSWSAEDAGGFHYLVLYTGHGAKGPGALGYDGWKRRVEAQLGPSAYQDQQMSIWLMPGAPPLP